MDKKLIGIFVGATVCGFGYTLRRLVQAERRHDALVDAILEDKEQQMQVMTDAIFADIVEHYDEI